MKPKPGRKHDTRCVYCGVPTRGQLACSLHAQLLKSDPQYVSERKR